MNFIIRTLATALISVIFVTLVFGNITAHADPDTSEINENNITLIGRMDMTALQELLDESGTCLQNFSRYGTSNIYFLLQAETTIHILLDVLFLQTYLLR